LQKRPIILRSLLIVATPYGVATISRMLKNTGLFCKRALQKRPVFCKETCIFKHPTHRSHPIALSSMPYYMSHICVYIYQSIYSQHLITLFAQGFSREASLRAIIALSSTSYNTSPDAADDSVRELGVAETQIVPKSTAKLTDCLLWLCERLGDSVRRERERERVSERERESVCVCVRVAV